MTTVSFESVWFLPSENQWKDFNPLAYKDVGTLVVLDSSLEYRGRNGVLVIRNIQKISYGKQGRDFVNNWVKVEYKDGLSSATAFFADGTLRGWGGIFGGTKKILAAVQGLA